MFVSFIIRALSGSQFLSSTNVRLVMTATFELRSLGKRLKMIEDSSSWLLAF